MLTRLKIVNKNNIDICKIIEISYGFDSSYDYNTETYSVHVHVIHKGIYKILTLSSTIDAYSTFNGFNKNKNFDALVNKLGKEYTGESTIDEKMLSFLYHPETSFIELLYPPYEGFGYSPFKNEQGYNQAILFGKIDYQFVK